MAGMRIDIRKAGPEDLAGVVELWVEHLDYHARCDPYFARAPGADEGFLKYLQESLAEIGLLVAEDQDHLVGFILLEIASRPPCFVERRYGMVTDIAVTEAYRGHKIAAQLLAQGLAWFKAQGIRRVETRILDANPLASAFWKSAGFHPYLTCSYLEI